jgi:acetoin:2,6-dichlorophenolindophenol oxidoreductase subunit alpha
MPTTQPSKEQLLALYERMLLIRRMEERLRADAAAGNLPGAVHLYIGQEAIATGVCAQLRDTDLITSTHRGHGHFLAKGGDPKAMMAEIWAKRTGICKGMGGSMHVADFSKGILGANGIVGGGFAIATGAALASKLTHDTRVSVAFFGDGAANQGVFMECLNVSSLWKLPLVLVCEHNQFSEFTPSADITSGDIADRARAFKISTAVVDGNDVVAVWQAAGEAIERARRGEGPCFIEAHTYRIQGHLEAEDLFLAGGKYREKQEIDEWRKRDPVERQRQRVLAAGFRPEELQAIDARTSAAVEQAVQFARDSEPADPELPFDLMFVGQKA